MPYHLPQIIKGIAQAVWFVADKVAVYDPEGLGSVQAWEDADGRNEQIKKGIITAGDCFVDGIVNATWHDRIKGATRLIADFYVPGKVYGALGHVFAEAVQQSKQLRNIENIASMLDEELGFEKYMHEIEQTAKGLNPATPEGFKANLLVDILKNESLYSEMNAFDKAKNVVKSQGAGVSKTITEFEKSAKALIDKNFEPVRVNKYGIIEERSFIEKKISALEKAQEKAVRVRELPDGRIRYYDQESLSKTYGPTRGRSHVTEFDPKTSRVRQWSECYDHQGKVNRINPKMIDGKEINSFHYPPIKKELEIIAQKIRSKK